MNQQHPAQSFNRRAFLKTGAAGAVAALGLTQVSRAEQQPVASDNAGQSQLPAGTGSASAVYRTLGRTGLKVSIVAVGAMQTREPAVMQAGFERGSNYIDTAECYMGGRNEEYVGKALKGYRDKVYVATKVHIAEVPAMMKSVEDSLRRLDLEYVDVMQLHGVSSKEEVMDARAREALAQLKQQGKIRFMGVTTHQNEDKVLDAVREDPDRFYDTVLVAYNFKKPPEIKAAIERASKAGVGIIAMKTQAGGYQTTELGEISPHQAALKWVLLDANVHTSIPSMIDLAQVEEDTAVMPMLSMSKAERQVLDRYGKAIAGLYCIGCSGCDATCPQRVDIQTVNRCLMYVEGYGNYELARSAYREIPVQNSISACGNCATCVAKCRQGLALSERMRKAQSLFA